MGNILLERESLVGVQVKEGFIVFSDLKGFSKLETKEQDRYLTVYVNLLSDTMKPSLEKALLSNTWGDAIIAVFENGMDAAEFMLLYRQEAGKNLGAVTEKKVLPRIAGHYGKVSIFDDPLLNRPNTISEEVNTAARVEPITRPGEIFVTKEFENAFQLKEGDQRKVKFEPLGMIPLAKDYGERELFRLINWTEKRHIIEKLIKVNLPKALPKDPELDGNEKQRIEQLKLLTDRERILAFLEDEWGNESTGVFALEVAGICKKAGLYQEGINWLERAQNICIETSGISLFPFKTKKEVIKLKADLLTRLELYDESAEILYSLWRNIEGDNVKDASEILAMLAAQFKRRAILRDNRIMPAEEINYDLLKKAANLYLEAFRHNIDDFYPAINAAYLLVMLGGKMAQDGRKLAIYIKDTWGHQRGTSYWLDFTLAETELLQGIYDEAKEEFEHALETHEEKIGVFDLEATKMQILQYLTIMDLREEGEELIQLLEEAIQEKQIH